MVVSSMSVNRRSRRVADFLFYDWLLISRDQYMFFHWIKIAFYQVKHGIFQDKSCFFSSL